MGFLAHRYRQQHVEQLETTFFSSYVQMVVNSVKSHAVKDATLINE